VHDLAGGHYRRKRPFSFRSREIYERRKNEINPRSEPIQLFSLRVGPGVSEWLFGALLFLDRPKQGSTNPLQVKIVRRKQRG
jgi:hypothetical protein